MNESIKVKGSEKKDKTTYPYKLYIELQMTVL